ncbi:MAG TPA: glycosyltransferase family 2 protein [Saprospiraceae bacterium]|nr:glycosyltransferase family 2 protein [Saprospiraceae bacterium]
MLKVSVILPTYNSERRLQRTLDSITGQTGKGTDFTIELIVVDDCSTDQTQEILRQNRIEFLRTHAHCGGPNKGRNIGLKHASGDYICFIDHDDLWAKDKIQCQLKVAQICPIVSTGYTVIDMFHHTGLSDTSDAGEIKILPKNGAFLQKLTRNKKGQQPYPSTLMINKALKHIRFEERFGMVDYDWQLRLFENHSYAIISKPLVTRYVTGGNLSLNKEYRKIDYQYSLTSLEWYTQRYPREVELARKHINGTLARYFYVTGEMHAARKYFRKSIWDLKTILYYFTSYYGNNLVKKHFRVFG